MHINYSTSRNLALLCLFLCQLLQAQTGMHEKRLLSHLFNKSRWDAHNPMERPSAIDGKPLKVFLKCFLNQIMDMDEKNQVLSTILWLDMKWTDYHFKWESSEYGNIRQLNLPSTRLWKPDLLLYNSASEKFDQIFPANVIVQNTGAIAWIPPGLFHSICAVKVNWFPFDSQSCILKFGTWTYQGSTVDLKLQCDNETDGDEECNRINEVDLSAYLSHSEWALESAVIKRHEENFGEPGESYISVIIRVDIQRKALYYMFNIIVPCMIMSVMSLLVFTLPPDANEKIVLGVTTLLSLTMLLQLVGDKLPQTSAGNPVLVLYFTCTIVLCSLSLVCAVVLLNCHHHSGGILHVPWLIGTFVNGWLGSVLRIDRPAESQAEIHEDQQESKSFSMPFSLAMRPNGNIKSTTCSQKPEFNVVDELELEFRPKVFSPTITNIYFQDKIEPSVPKKLRDIAAIGEYLLSFNTAGSNDLYRVERHTVHSADPKMRAGETTFHFDYGRDQSNQSNVSLENSRTCSPMNNNNREKLLREITEKAVILKRLRDLTKEVRYVTGRMHHKDAEARTSNEWRMACRVLDRLCLIVFAALNLFTTFGILTSAPTIIKAFTTRGAPSQPM